MDNSLADLRKYMTTISPGGIADTTKIEKLPAAPSNSSRDGRRLWVTAKYPKSSGKFPLLLVVNGRAADLLAFWAGPVCCHRTTLPVSRHYDSTCDRRLSIFLDRKRGRMVVDLFD